MTIWKKRSANRAPFWAALCCLCMATAAQAERPHSPIENRNLAAEKAAPEKKKTSPLTDQVDLTMTFAVDSLCRIIDPRHTLDEFWENLLSL